MASFPPDPAPPHLLLLPSAPQHATYPALKALYGPALTSTLKTVSSKPSRTILDVAVPSTLFASTSQKRADLYDRAQTLVAGVYKLVVVVAAKLGVEVADVPGDAVDVRVILVADGQEQGSGEDEWVGPVVSLQTLARSGREWTRIFTVEGDVGAAELFLQSVGGAKQYMYEKVPSGEASPASIPPADSTLPSTASFTSRSSCVGGTFDHLHIGHKLLLTMTAFALDHPSTNSATASSPGPTAILTIGMTAADLLASKKYAEALQSWHVRTARTHAFLRAILVFSPSSAHAERVMETHDPGPNGHAVHVDVALGGHTLQLRYVEIWDPFGPTITDGGIDTLIVSGETRGGGKAVNDKRREIGLKSVMVREVDVLDAEEGEGGDKESFEAKLSSTAIRRVEAERKKAQERSKV